MFTEKAWGYASGYDLCINTSGKQIKELIDPIVAYIEKYNTEEK